MERQERDHIRMAGQCIKALAGAGVPYAYSTVGAGCGEQLPLFIIADRIDRFGVLFEIGDGRVLGYIPEFNGLVIAGGGDLFAVRTPGEAIDAVGMALN